MVLLGALVWACADGGGRGGDDAPDDEDALDGEEDEADSDGDLAGDANPTARPPDPIVVSPGATAYLPGGGSVNRTGGYEYTLPLHVPAGRAGMQPTLALHYSNRNPDTLTGIGWSLAGLSEIHRCNRAFHVDGYADGVDLDDEDALCLDGQKLVKINGSEYRTERDPFAKIVGDTGESFTIYRKDGTIAEYRPGEHGWPIASVRDRSGNEVRYTWGANGKSMRIEQIDYTGTFGDSEAPPFSIAFEYDPRPRPLSGYVAGEWISAVDHLVGITVQGPGGIGWNYTLAHSVSPVSGKLRLDAVELCSAGTCPQPTRFEYEEAAPTWVTQNSAWQLQTEFESDAKLHDPAPVHVLDLNHDGKDDVLFTAGSVSYTWRSGHVGVKDVEAFHDRTPVVVDVNGDDGMEVVAFDDAASRWRLYQWDEPDWPEFVENPWFPLIQLTSMPNHIQSKLIDRERPAFADLDGDGLPELIRPHHWQASPHTWGVGVEVWWNDAGQYSSLPSIHFPSEFYPPPETMDGVQVQWENFPGAVDVHAEDRFGDRRQGLVLRKADGSGDLVLRRDDTGAMVVNGTSSGPLHRIDIDLDADGLRDRVYPPEPPLPTDPPPAPPPAPCSGMTSDSNHGGPDYEPGPAVTMEGCPNHDEEDWVVADIDGDRQEDIVFFPKPALRKHPVMRVVRGTSEADGVMPSTTVESGLPEFTPEGQADAMWRTKTVRVGDFDGDGRADLLLVATLCVELNEGTEACDYSEDNGALFRIFSRQSPEPDQLVRVWDEDAAGDRERVTYVPWGAAGTEEPNGSCHHPNSCVRRGFPVVRIHEFANASTGSADVLDRAVYTYSEPRVHRNGRGFIGFHEVRAWYPNRPMEVISTYGIDSGPDWTYPWANAPYSVFTVTPILETTEHVRVPGEDQPEAVMARVVRVQYDHGYEALNSGETFWTPLESRKTFEWEESATIDWTAPDYAKPRIRLEGVGQEHPDRTTLEEFTYDTIGNATTHDVLTVGGTRAQVENVYQYPAGDWPVARQTHEHVRSAVSETAPWQTRTTAFGYDAKHRVTNIAMAPGSAAARSVGIVRDPVSGLIEQVTQVALGEPARDTFLEYDDTGAMLVSVTNALGHEVAAVVEPTLGIVTSVTDANGVTSHLVHDGLGRIRGVHPAGAASTAVSYALAELPEGYGGVTTESVSAAGGESQVVRDVSGRVTSSCATAFSGALACVYAGYDIVGNPQWTTRPGPQGAPLPATTRAFDTLGRPLHEQRPDGAVAAWDHTFLTTRAWDWNGNEHLAVRDIDDRLVSMIDYVDNAHVTTSFTYGPFDLPTTTVDDQGNIASVVYDNEGRRVALSDPDLGWNSFTHNAFDEEIGAVLADGNTVNHTRDLLGRVTSTTDADGTTTYVWDTSAHGIGQLARTTSADGATDTSYAYDGFGRLATSTWMLEDGESFSIGVARDVHGRVKAVDYPEVAGWPKMTVNTSYNPAGYVRELEARIGDRSAIETVELWEVDARAHDGALLAGHLGNGLTTTRSHDVIGRLDSLAWSGASALHDVYGYDDVGNVLSISDPTNGRLEQYVHDEVGRVTQWSIGAAKVVDYTYDTIGNIVRVHDQGVLVEKNTYDSNGKPHALASDGFGAMFTHDPRGRMTEQPDRVLAYTTFDLPSSVTTPEGTTWFQYDALHDRVVKSDGESTVVTIGGLYERRTDADGVVHTFHVPGTDGMVADVIYDEAATGREIRYFAGDRKGNVRLVTDEDGNEVARNWYDPFGRRVTSHGAPPIGDFGGSLGYEAHPHDDELGFVDMGGRVYDPTRRRFLTPDPFVPAPTFGQSWNRYTLAFNNAVTLNDPTGFWPDDEPELPQPPVDLGNPIDLLDSVANALDPDGDRPWDGRVGHDPPKLQPLAPDPPPPTVHSNLQNYGAGFTETSNRFSASYLSRGLAPLCDEPDGMVCMEFGAAPMPASKEDSAENDAYHLRLERPDTFEINVQEAAVGPALRILALTAARLSKSARAARVFRKYVRRAEKYFRHHPEKIMHYGGSAKGHPVSAGQLGAAAERKEFAHLLVGNAMEARVAELIRASARHRNLFKHVGGPNRIDFVGMGKFKGFSVDVTSVMGEANHWLRPYMRRKGAMVETYNSLF